MLFCSTFSTATSIGFCSCGQAGAAGLRAWRGRGLHQPGSPPLPAAGRTVDVRNTPCAGRVPHGRLSPQCRHRPRLQRRRRRRHPEMAAACAAAGSPGAVLRGFRGPGPGRRTWAAGLTCTPWAAAGCGSRHGGVPTPPPRPRGLDPFTENQTQPPRKLKARLARVPGAPTVCRASGPLRSAVQAAATRFAAGQTQLRPLPPRMA